ncbi:hypothetical protein RO07_25005 [Pandoraea pulmonicola]|uniref:AB hydrolase-1 domain-containing protein n=1 Tax=Pandoraea pulmonicola TaxID=93221 RepID=A0ABN4UEC4_PANPU|nr:hypothetical protein RO07_25005 [Pandoraea pulmonicola]
MAATILYPPDGTPLRAVAVIAGALGVSSRFYMKFAAFLAQHGIAALTFDYRGTGKSAVATDPRGLRLAKWGTQDIDALIRRATDMAEGRPVFVVGHSMGAQLLGLAVRARRLSGAMFLGASFPNVRRWPLRRMLMPFLLFNVLIPVIGRLSRSFPAKALGLGSETIPSALMRDWGRWTRHERYLLAPEFGLNGASGYAELHLPVLAIEFSDDDYVPPAAAEALYAGYPKVDWEIRRKAVDTAPVGHFGFFSDSHRSTYWQEALDWLNCRIRTART